MPRRLTTVSTFAAGMVTMVMASLAWSTLSAQSSSLLYVKTA